MQTLLKTTLAIWTLFWIFCINRETFFWASEIWGLAARSCSRTVHNRSRTLLRLLDLKPLTLTGLKARHSPQPIHNLYSSCGRTVPVKIIWWNAMPDQDYWIVDWKVRSLVRWSGAGSVRNLAFLDLIVNKSQKPIKAFLLDGNQSKRASQNYLMECDAGSGLLDCWLKGWRSGSLVWSRFSQKPRISGSNSKKINVPTSWSSKYSAQRPNRLFS